MKIISARNSIKNSKQLTLIALYSLPASTARTFSLLLRQRKRRDRILDCVRRQCRSVSRRSIFLPEKKPVL